MRISEHTQPQQCLHQVWHTAHYTTCAMKHYTITARDTDFMCECTHMHTRTHTHTAHTHTHTHTAHTHTHTHCAEYIPYPMSSGGCPLTCGAAAVGGDMYSCLLPAPNTPAQREETVTHSQCRSKASSEAGGAAVDTTPKLPLTV